jgi:hypothetical protein
MLPSSLTGFEKAAQSRRIRRVRAQLDGIDTGRLKEAAKISLGAFLALPENPTLAFIAGVDFDDFAGLGVLQNEITQRRQFRLVTIGDLDGDDVVLAIGLAQSRGGSLAEGFGKHDATAKMRGDISAARRSLAKKI